MSYEQFSRVGWGRSKVHFQVIIKNIAAEETIYDALSAKIRQTKK